MGDVVGMSCYWFCDETSQFELENYYIHLFFWKLPYFSIAHGRNFGHVTSLIVHDHFLYAKSNLLHFWQKSPSMEAISQIIRSVGLFVSSSPEVTITKNQPFLYILKNGLIEVPDFVYSLLNCWDVVLLILWWNLTVWAWKLFLFIFFSWKLPYFCIAHARNFGHLTSLIVHDHFLYAKSNLNHFRQTPPSMKAISQIIRYVGLFVSSSPEVTISTKISHFYISSKMARLKYQILFILYQIVGRCCRDAVLLILWWNITVWARKLFLFIFFSENCHILAWRMRGISVTWPH